MKHRTIFIFLLVVNIVVLQAKVFDTSQFIKVQEKSTEYWINGGRDDIVEALNRPKIETVAKNIIIFLGDGMGPTVATAGRIFKGQKRGVSGEEGYLSWERLSNMAMLKTYNVDVQVPDSAATATAFLCGVKGNFYTVAVNANVKMDECKKSLNENTHTDSILKWAQDAGKDTGFVTTTRLTHATPAALYSHSASRKWECDSRVKEAGTVAEGCRDIATQLVEDLPGRNINVILAGGRRQMGAALEGDEPNGCARNDSRNLVEEWKEDKKKRGFTHHYVNNKQGLDDFNVKDTDYIMGLFSGGHLPYEYYRQKDHNDVPSLKELTVKAIQRLQGSDEGYFLMVEGGRIDHGLHDTKPRLAMEEMIAFDEAVEAALNMVDIEDTLFLVTADHSHAMTMNGYPDRGNDILGKATYEYVTDNMPYTTLMFTTGVGTNFTYNGTNVVRSNITNIDTTDPEYISMAIVPTVYGYETHGGEDVAVFAQGPMAHLFHRLHEQTYVAHVMGYAACIGPFRNDCPRHGTNRKPDDYHHYDTLDTSSSRPPISSKGRNISISKASFLVLFIIAQIATMIYR